MRLRQLAVCIWFGAGMLAPAEAVELPKVLPPHPRLLVNQQDLPALKERSRD